MIVVILLVMKVSSKSLQTPTYLEISVNIFLLVLGNLIPHYIRNEFLLPEIKCVSLVDTGIIPKLIKNHI